MMPFDDFLKTVETIPYRYSHPPFLYALIKWLKPKVVVEVGTHIGYAACWMARALQENGEGIVVCIDNFCWTDESQESQWRNNITDCGVDGYIGLIQGRSEEVEWPSKVDFAFIDGNHKYSVCKHDAEKALSLGATCICLHDTVQCDGPRKQAFEMRPAGCVDWRWHDFDFLENNAECGLLVALKRQPKGPIVEYDDGPSAKWDKEAWK